MKLILKRRNVAFSWFISYVFLVVLSISANLIAYINIENQIEQQTSNYTMEMLQGKKISIDSLHTHLRRISYELQENENIRKAAFSSDNSQYPNYNMIEICSELNQYISALDNVENIYIYFHNMDYCVGAFNANFSDNFFSVNVAENGIDYSLWIETVKKRHIDEFITFDLNEKKILYMQSICNFERFVPYATIVIEISSDKFLLPSSIEEYGDGFAILDKNNDVFIAKSKEKLDILTEITDKNEVDIGVSDYGNQIMIADKSDVNEWKYVFLVDKSVFQHSVDSARKKIIVWNFIGICFAIVFSLLSVHKNYKPLRRLVSLLVKKDIVSLEDMYDAEKIMTNILHENNVYNSYAKSMQNDAVKGAFLSRLLTEKIKIDNQKEILFSLGIDFKYKNYLVVLFYLDITSDMFFDDKNDDAAKAYQLAKATLINILNDLIDEQFVVEYCDVNGMLGCIVNFDNENEAEVFVGIIERLEEIMYNNFNISFGAGISNSSDNIYSFSYCYDEAMRCIEERCFNEGDIIKYSDINDEVGMMVGITAKSEEILINAIFACDVGTIKREIDNIFENVIVSGNNSFTDVKIILYDFIKIMTKIINENGNPERDANVISEMAKLIESINVHNGLSKTKTNLNEIIGNFCSKNMSTIKSKTEILINKAKTYIDENYSNCDLTVLSVAKQCGVSVPHLSSRFKKESGTGVLEYIVLKRIELAKEMLLNSNDTIEQISNSVGYENRRSFVRVFTQHTGVSPSRYRMLIMGSKEE